MPLPYPVTSMVRQWRNGEFAVQFRFEKKASGECWSAAYQRLDLKTYKARAAMVSRSVQAYGSEFAREAVEVAWREAVTEQARLVPACPPGRSHLPSRSNDRRPSLSQVSGARQRCHPEIYPVMAAPSAQSALQLSVSSTAPRVSTLSSAATYLYPSA